MGSRGRSRHRVCVRAAWDTEMGGEKPPSIFGMPAELALSEGDRGGSGSWSRNSACQRLCKLKSRLGAGRLEPRPRAGFPQGWAIMAL
ncbi:hypothetical protein NDU88_008184 [Pleurodeles waltl]|uniref:Uncharacterized protein n=1 Tax=Pleurodeles waltl TaxID=8319 RepID=A0AAV7VV15_PLEWA|nr:hypothetical protein NDU88_008184 [Pleurodeles waltl]